MTTKLRELCEVVCALHSNESYCEHPELELYRALVDAVEQSGRGDPSRLEIAARFYAAFATTVDDWSYEVAVQEADKLIAAARKDSGEADPTPRDWREQPDGHPVDTVANAAVDTSPLPAGCFDSSGVCREFRPQGNEVPIRAPLPAELRERLGREAYQAYVDGGIDPWADIGEHIYRLTMAEANDLLGKRIVELVKQRDEAEQKAKQTRCCDSEDLCDFHLSVLEDWCAQEAEKRSPKRVRDARDAAIARAEQAERERDTETRRSRAWQSAHDVECERRRQAEQERDELRAKLATAERAWRYLVDCIKQNYDPGECPEMHPPEGA